MGLMSERGALIRNCSVTPTSAPPEKAESAVAPTSLEAPEAPKEVPVAATELEENVSSPEGKGD